jgi:hypothetical protein
MKTLFYKRSGERTSRAYVRRNRLGYARAKRIGRLGELMVSVQPTVAERYETMTEEEYCTHTGAFTYRKFHE